VVTDSAYGSEQEIVILKPSTIRWIFGTFAGWMNLMACFIFLGFLSIFCVWLRNICTKFIITNQRVKLETGIIFRRIDEVELYRIKDVKVDYSLLNQVFNIGTITLRSSDPTTRDHALIIPYVLDARKVRETLRNAIEQSRRRRGVREVDIEPMAYVS
jgi:uncharacterized membrane protein YdbT with pleckstrin-like domain